MMAEGEDFGFVDRLSSPSSHDDNLNPNNQTRKSGSGSSSLVVESSTDDDRSTKSRKKNSNASQSSADFGKGSPLPGRNANMLKHVNSGSSKAEGGEEADAGSGQVSSGESPTAGKQAGDKTSTPSESTGIQVKLPQRFVVKYLGFRETSNLWGIKYTRRPVDEMVAEAKKGLVTNPGKALALLRIDVTEEGIVVGPMPQNTNPNCPTGKFSIETISYGVQDLVYTRVFAMIVVRPDGQSADVKMSQLTLSNQSQNGSSSSGLSSLPFRCHGFVCDSRQTARRLTYSLASAFEVFSKKVASGKLTVAKPKKFAIDLRPTEEIEADLADSEA